MYHRAAFVHAVHVVVHHYLPLWVPDNLAFVGCWHSGCRPIFTATNVFRYFHMPRFSFVTPLLLLQDWSSCLLEQASRGDLDAAASGKQRRTDLSFLLSAVLPTYAVYCKYFIIEETAKITDGVGSGCCCL